MIDCSKVPTLKRRVTLGILVFTSIPLVIALLGSFLGALGLIGPEATNALEFLAFYFEITFVLGGLAFIIASIYFTTAERRCGVQHTTSFLNIVVGVFAGVVLLVFLYLFLSTVSGSL